MPTLPPAAHYSVRAAYTCLQQWQYPEGTHVLNFTNGSVTVMLLVVYSEQPYITFKEKGMVRIARDETRHREAAELGRRIRTVRVAAGLTQAGLAEQLGKQPSWLANIERGVNEITALDLGKLARLLGYDQDWFTDPDYPDPRRRGQPAKAGRDLTYLIYASRKHARRTLVGAH